jgi:hypothetical protein
VSAFFGGCRLQKNFRVFFNRVFELPLFRNAQKRDKKNRAKQPREKNQNGGKKATFFVMSPQMDFFEKQLSCFLTPLVTKRPKKRDKKFD